MLLRTISLSISALFKMKLADKWKKKSPLFAQAMGLHEKEYNHVVQVQYTVKILKFGTPQTIAIIVLKIEKFDVTLH